MRELLTSQQLRNGRDIFVVFRVISQSYKNFPYVELKGKKSFFRFNLIKVRIEWECIL